MGFDAATLSMIAVVVAVFIVVVLIRAVRKPRRGPQAAPPHLVKPVPAEVQVRVGEELSGGRKIQAIKEVRKATGYGLKEAKDIVEAMAAGWSVPGGPGEHAGGLVRGVGELGDQSRGVRPVPAEVQVRVGEELSGGRKIQAIKEVRKATGYGLKEAKDIVEAMAAGWSVPSGPGEHAGGLAHRVRELREQRRMGDAIRLITEQTGMNEAEAVRMIESLD